MAHSSNSCCVTQSRKNANQFFPLYQFAAKSRRAEAREESGSRRQQNKPSHSRVAFPKGAFKVTTGVNSARLSPLASSAQRHGHVTFPFQALCNFSFLIFPFYEGAFTRGFLFVIFFFWSNCCHSPPTSLQTGIFALCSVQ